MVLVPKFFYIRYTQRIKQLENYGCSAFSYSFFSVPYWLFTVTIVVANVTIIKHCVNASDVHEALYIIM